MSLSFSAFGDGDADESIAEINMIPLIDVMLVLLVIFIVAAPLLTHAVPLELPRVNSPAVNAPVPPVQLSIDRVGHLYWNGELMPFEKIRERMMLAAKSADSERPELHIRAARTTPYERLALVLSAATELGLTRIGFVTEPAPES